jgi:Secretion system C-terminal sorting domain
MRKHLLRIAFACLVTAGLAQAQNCTPNAFIVSLNVPGVYPNPVLQGSLTAGSSGSAYSETITILTLADTTIDLSPFTGGIPVPPVNVAIDYQVINNVTGLPAGLSYNCRPASCSIPGDSSGCVGITGTPTQSGTFTIGLDTEIGITVPNTIPLIGGTVLELPVPGISWTLEISGGTNIGDPNQNALSFQGVGPHPFSSTTTLHFYSAKPAQISLEVRDMTGRLVAADRVRANTGDNTHMIDGSTWGAGIYLLSLSDGSRKVTEKLVVTE